MTDDIKALQDRIRELEEEIKDWKDGSAAESSVRGWMT